MFSYIERTANKMQYEDLGFNPMSLLPKTLRKKPYIDDELRIGTT